MPCPCVMSVMYGTCHCLSTYFGCAQLYDYDSLLDHCRHVENHVYNFRLQCIVREDFFMDGFTGILIANSACTFILKILICV